MDRESSPPSESALVEELKRANLLLAKYVYNQRSWKLALRQGLLTGLGATIGATLLVSLLLWILQPLKHLELLKQPLDRISQELEKRPSK